MRRIVVILFFACIFAVATVASAKVCFLPHIFGGDESCLSGHGSSGGGDLIPPVPPTPANPGECAENEVSHMMSGFEGTLFNYDETDYNSGCYTITCSNVHGSRPNNTFDMSVFEVFQISHGNLTCYYAGACHPPYENVHDKPSSEICVGGYIAEDYPLDGLRCVKCVEHTGLCQEVNPCVGYDFDSAPTYGTLAGDSCQKVSEVNGECVYGDVYYNDFECDEGYKKNNSSCVAKTCSDYGYQSSHCANPDDETEHLVNLGPMPKICYECSCTPNECPGSTTLKPHMLVTEWCTRVTENCTYHPRVMEFDCEVGYQKSGNTCVEMTGCYDDPCTGYNLSSIPENSTATDSCQIKYKNCSTGATKYLDFICNAGYVQVGNDCEPSQTCETDLCYGYSVYSIPENATSTGSCQVVYSDCTTGATRHLGFECNEGYVEVGNKCRLIQSPCTPESCTGYNYASSTLPPNSHGVNECQIVNTDCSNGALKYADFACNNGYERSGNACVPTSSCTPEPCTGYSYTASTLPANSHGVNSCQVTVAPDCANGDLKYADFACDGGWIKQGTQCVEPTPMTCADVPGSPPATQAECENDCVSCRSQNFQGVWCWVPSGCKSGCVTGSDKVSFYDYTSYGNDCYKPSGCASGWQSGSCSGTGAYSYTGTKTAHGSSIECTQCERCTESYHRYNSAADCNAAHWPEYCQSNTYGTDPSVTCWDGSCSKAEHPYALGLITGYLVDDRDCCAHDYCSNFLCDEYNGYIRSGNGCVCNTAGGWEAGADGTCSCPGHVDIDKRCITQTSDPNSCPQTVVNAYNSISWTGSECLDSLTHFCELYVQNYSSCKLVYSHITLSDCNSPANFANHACEQTLEP
ncbi:MAG: hypothetical protein IJS26_04195 [Alphaproteobacteria bacterium]|nr:hypothetical protein [Alphaproteobacteria bacterium]